MPELIDPTSAVHSSFLTAMEEFAAEGRGGDDTMVGRDLAEWGGRWTTDAGFAAYLATVLADRERDAPRPPGWVPSTTLWWVDGGVYLGRVAIRHWLSPALLGSGGHLGYDVRRSARRQGHATTMLAAALPIAAGLGIDPALVMCDSTNVGSRRVIEINGGILHDQRGGKLRFWVATSGGTAGGRADD